MTTRTDPSLTSINVNLLVALDALLTEHNVTRAARRIGISQSAMSHNLATLRALLGDPLLVRGPGGMEPTVRGREIGGKLRRALGDLEAAIAREPRFDPERSSRQFRVAAKDLVAERLAVELVRRLGTEAPGVEVVFRPFPAAGGGAALEDPDIDLVVGPRIHGADVRRRHLYAEDLVCVVRRGHPTVEEHLSLQQYAAEAHLLVSPTGSGASRVDEILEAHGLSRKIVLRVPWFSLAPLVVAQTDLVLTTARATVARLADRLNLRWFEAPFDAGHLDVVMSWHARNDTDPAQVWFRQLVLDGLLDGSASWRPGAGPMPTPLQ